jgi:membrane protein YdbS with pleckstrin-like domain
MSDEPEETPPPGGIFANARRFAAAAGLVAGALVALAAWLTMPAAPWWMYPFLFVVVLTVVFRLLRPMKRRPGWEDEI